MDLYITLQSHTHLTVFWKDARRPRILGIAN